MSDFLKGLGTGAASAGIMGAIGAVLVGGVTALFGGPVAVAAAVGVGLFGLLGSALGAVACGTSPGAGDWRANWIAGLSLTAAMSFGAHAALAPSPESPPKKTPPAVSMKFNAQSPRNAAEAIALSRAPLYVPRPASGPV